MEKALTKFMKGRTRIAVVMMVCLVAIVALPGMAFAGFASEYPAPSATIHGQPAVVSVDVLGSTLNVKGATISVGGTVLPATVKQGLDAGTWASNELLWADGYYHTVWSWAPVVGTPMAKATLYAYPSVALPTGSVAVSASAKDSAGAAVGPDAWSFTVAAPIVIPPTPGSDRTKFNAGCRSAGCHGTQFDADPAMGTDCTACHYDGFPKHGIKIVLAHLTVQSEISANSAGCVSCHGGNLQSVLPANWDNNGAASEHSYCSCHVYNEADGKTACEDCHVQPMDAAAPHPYHVGAHAALEAGIAGTKSSACVACHGSNIQNVSAGPMTQGEHKGCSCHARGEAEGAAECVDCHKDGEAAHGFANGLAHTGGGWIAASGHNTTTYGTIGAKTKFDGSQGVTLKWESEIASPALSASFQTNLGVTSLTTGQTGTLITNWDFPTVSVFWDAADPLAPATAVKGLTKTSTITCQDCHTGLNAAGPHGAAQNFGIDPAYPGDYSYAELTKYVTANLNFPVADARYSTPLSVSGIAMFPGAATHSDLTSASVASTATLTNWALPMTGLAARTDGTTGDTAVICAKCHKLETAVTVAGVTSVVGANTAHNSHHQDQIDGTAQCVNCHIGVPHGWTRPRLLVNTDVDEAPIFDPQALGTTRATSTGELNTGDTRQLTAGFGQGFNRQGMQSLSGWDQHTLVTTGASTGQAAWTEASCQACGDHAGEDGVRIVESE